MHDAGPICNHLGNHLGSRLGSHLGNDLGSFGKALVCPDI
jgi:hypothetical protein